MTESGTNSSDRSPDLERAIQEINKNIERLFTGQEIQRVKADEQERAITNLAMGKKGVSLLRQKNPENGIGSSNGSESYVLEGGEALVRQKFKKVEIPVFDGLQPDDWIFRAERYFEIHDLTEAEKVTVAAISFTGEALHWLRWKGARTPFEGWRDLKRKLLDRFHPTQEGSTCARFLAIKQEGTVAEYRARFEVLAAAVPELPDDVMEGTFINGLQEGIRTEMMCFEPEGLEAMMRMAQRVEDTIQARNRGKPISTGKPISGSLLLSNHAFNSGAGDRSGQITFNKGTQRVIEPNPIRTVALTTQNSTTRKELPYRRLTDSELQKKKEKGLCYRCDEKFFVGHRCKSKELRLLVLWRLL